MTTLAEQYGSGLLFRVPTRTLEEDAAGSMTDVSLREALEEITSVSDVGGQASFNHAGTLLVVGQEVRITGFVSETTYNGSFIVTAASAGDFEVGLTFTGTEATGDFELLVARVRSLLAGDAYKTIYEDLYDFEEDDQAPSQRDTVQTTDATTNVLLGTLTIDTNTTRLIRSRIFLTETDTDAGYMEIHSTVVRAGGAPSLSVNPTNPTINLSPAGWGSVDADFAVSGNDIIIQVDGQAATTIDWIALTHIESFT